VGFQTAAPASHGSTPLPGGRAFDGNICARFVFGDALAASFIGKPEPLRGNLAGFWFRRIDEQNRLVYEATDDQLLIISCRYHYE
jgi:hypothetical protein